MDICLSNKTKGILSFISGILLHFVLGSVDSFILLSPFLLSYLRSFDDTIVVDDGFWFFPICVTCCTLTVFIGGILDKKFGPRL